MTGLFIPHLYVEITLTIAGVAAPKLSILGLTPNASGQYQVSATLGQPISFKLAASSEAGLAILYHTVGNLPTTSLDVTTGQFTWTPSNLNPMDVR